MHEVNLQNLRVIFSGEGKGCTPLRCATAYADPNLIEVLLQAGANADDWAKTMAHSSSLEQHTGGAQARSSDQVGQLTAQKAKAYCMIIKMEVETLRLENNKRDMAISNLRDQQF